MRLPSIYTREVYTVIIVEWQTFKKITEHLIPPFSSNVKFLLANDVETKYLEEILGQSLEEWRIDYYRIEMYPE